MRQRGILPVTLAISHGLVFASPASASPTVMWQIRQDERIHRGVRDILA